MLASHSDSFQPKKHYCEKPDIRLYKTTMKTKWHIHSQDPDQIAELSASYGCHRAIAAILINRGITMSDQAENFIKPSLHHIRSPFLMKDMDKAVSRIVRALHKHEKILIFGDYDVDGMTATALLFDFLGYIGASVDYYIPDRLTEGYSLNPGAVNNYAIPHKISLIVTVDCGTTSHEAAKAAKKAGIDIIITDHHEPQDSLPEAVAVLNPKQKDCPSGLRELAGVGVAFNLALAIRKRLRDDGFWNSSRQEPNLKAACDLVALGTVADMAPLLEQNRIYVKAGLEIITSSPRPGLKALLDISGITNRDVNTWDIAFRLAPRLNAAGRLSHASVGFKLLTTSSDETARSIALQLDRENNKRKKTEDLILSDITAKLESNPQLIKNSLVLDSDTWHEGVIGIVASRLVARYMRPVVLIAIRNGLGKGSARSPEGFDIFKAFNGCAQHLERFGGHEVAAGLTLKVKNIPGFRKDFEQFVYQNADTQDFVPKLDIDTEINPTEICPALLNELEQLAPFGTGNHEPIFMISDLNVLSARTVGSGHTKMQLAQNRETGGRPMDAILFNNDIVKSSPRHFDRIACKLNWNNWMNKKRIQLVVKDFV